jgi:hypothetical protein
MGILALAADERIADVDVGEDELTVRLKDGRRISVPLTWYPRLLQATEEQRKRWRIAGGGYGIHWEEIDEDLSSEGLLRGAPAARPASRRETAQLRTITHAWTDTITKKPEVIVAEDSGDANKGILDHLIEGEEAAVELSTVLSWIQSETETFTTKISKHTSNIERLVKNSGGSTARDYKRVVLLAASDMTTFSKRVEDVLPNFAKSTETLDQSYSAYVGLANRNVPNDVERMSSLFNSLSHMLEIVGPAKAGIAGFRDTARSIRKQNISKELNQAADRQWKTLDNVLSEIERVESFALRISFQIEERIVQSPDS